MRNLIDGMMSIFDGMCSIFSWADRPCYKNNKYAKYARDAYLLRNRWYK